MKPDLTPEEIIVTSILGDFSYDRKQCDTFEEHRKCHREYVEKIIQLIDQQARKAFEASRKKLNIYNPITGKYGNCYLDYDHYKNETK